jgi:glutamine amidotransferase
MCRHVAYVGPPVLLDALIALPPYGLEKQSYAPRRQSHGLVNADGFGLGWYRHSRGAPPADAPPERAPTSEPEIPVVYRRAVPIWGDENLRQLAVATTSHAILGAVRSATPGHPVAEGACAPFTAGRWLFSHNGALPGWPACADALGAGLAPSALARQQTLIDSTLLWALLLTRLEAGADAAEATAEVTARARALTGGRVNLLLHDGTRIVATAAGDTLCYLQGAHPGPDGIPAPGVLVASEPFDDSDGWVVVPDDSLLVATADEVAVRPLVPSLEEVPS